MGRVRTARLSPASRARYPWPQTWALKDLPPSLRTDFDHGEKECNLLRRILDGIGPMHRVCFDRLGEILADGAGGGVCRVCRAHDFAVQRHRILPFEHLDDNRARTHKRDQIAVKRTPGMDLVEPLRLDLRKLDAFLSDDAEPALLEAVVDRAGKIAPGRVRFDDRQSPFNRHPHLSFEGAAGYTEHEDDRQPGAKRRVDSKLKFPAHI